MIKEYFRLQSPKDEFETDGSGQLSADNIETVLVKDAEGNEIEVEFEEKDGEVSPFLPEDIDDETAERLQSDEAFKRNLQETTKTLGKVRKERMEQNSAKRELEAEKAKLEAEKEQLEADKRAFARQKNGGGLTPEDAKKFWGVDTPEEVIQMQMDNPIAFLAGNNLMQSELTVARLAPLLQQRSNEPAIRTVNDIARRRTPKTVDGGVGGKAEKKVTMSDDERMSRAIAGV